MSTLDDLYAEGFPHGTKAGYDAGCRGKVACPNYGSEELMTCVEAVPLASGDPRYRVVVAQHPELAAARDWLDTRARRELLAHVDQLGAESPRSSSPAGTGAPTLVVSDPGTAIPEVVEPRPEDAPPLEPVTAERPSGLKPPPPLPRPSRRRFRRIRPVSRRSTRRPPRCAHGPRGRAWSARRRERSPIASAGRTSRQ